MDNFNYLKRKVNKSNKFDKFIKKTSCKAKKLGVGTTFKTMELLKANAYKYQNQTKKLANQLKDKNLAKTTKNIQDYLYNYHQYKADGFVQKILSPSCAYASRFSGFDCKTFTLIGSTILLNLKINHFLRKVKQPQDTNEYSHVYIVIPKDQVKNDLNKGYYVIDGTLKSQNEVLFKTKKDTFMNAVKMPHIGLNSPQQSEAQKIINNFKILLNNLKKLGYSDMTISSFRNAIMLFTNQGIDPIIYKDKNNKGIFIEDIFVPFVKKQGLNGFSSGLPNFNTAGVDLSFGGSGGPSFPTGGSLPSSTGSGVNFSQILGGLGALGNGGNLDAGNAVTMGADALTGGLVSGISSIIGFDVSDAINQILAGNWDCIGGSAWGQNDFIKETNLMKNYLEPKYQELKNATNFQVLNNAITLIDKYINTYIVWFQKFSTRKHYNSCSMKVFRKIIQAGEQQKSSFKNIINDLKKNYIINEQSITAPINWSEFGSTKRGRGWTTTYTKYTVTPKPKNNNQNNPKNNQGNETNINQSSKSSITTPLLIAAGIAKLAGVF